MPTTIVPYNLLTGANTGGTWSYVGTVSPNPAAPGTYNGSIDFAGYAAGTYTYRYTVTSGALSDTADVDILWNGVSVAPVNNACAGATMISGLQTCPSNTVFLTTNAQNCEQLLQAPTDSGVTEPASWIYTYGGDLWFKFIPPVCSASYQVQVQIQSIDTAAGFAVQVLRGTCNALESVVDSNSSVNATSVGVEVFVPAIQAIQYFVRVVSVTPGAFSITLSCSTACDHANAANLEYWPSDEVAGTNGIALGQVYALSPDNIYGLPHGDLRVRVN